MRDGLGEGDVVGGGVAGCVVGGGVDGVLGGGGGGAMPLLMRSTITVPRAAAEPAGGDV